MKQAAAIGGGLVVVALGAIGLGFLLMSGDGADGPEPAPTEVASEEPAEVPTLVDDEVAPEAEAAPKRRGKARANPTGRGLQVNNNAKTEFEEGDPNAPLGDAEKWKERRSQRNEVWRSEQLRIANDWVNSHGLEPAQGAEVIEVLNRAHDIIHDTRADIEGGVISPRVGREEMTFAKEEIDLEIKRLLGDDLGAQFLTEIGKASSGGF